MTTQIILGTKIPPNIVGEGLPNNPSLHPHFLSKKVHIKSV